MPAEARTAPEAPGTSLPSSSVAVQPHEFSGVVPVQRRSALADVASVFLAGTAAATGVVNSLADRQAASNYIENQKRIAADRAEADARQRAADEARAKAEEARAQALGEKAVYGQYLEDEGRIRQFAADNKLPHLVTQFYEEQSRSTVQDVRQHAKQSLAQLSEHAATADAQATEAAAKRIDTHRAQALNDLVSAATDGVRTEWVGNNIAGAPTGLTATDNLAYYASRIEEKIGQVSGPAGIDLSLMSPEDEQAFRRGVVLSASKLAAEQADKMRTAATDANQRAVESTAAYLMTGADPITSEGPQHPLITAARKYAAAEDQIQAAAKPGTEADVRHKTMISALLDTTGRLDRGDYSPEQSAESIAALQATIPQEWDTPENRQEIDRAWERWSKATVPHFRNDILTDAQSNNLSPIEMWSAVEPGSNITAADLLFVRLARQVGIDTGDATNLDAVTYPTEDAVKARAFDALLKARSDMRTEAKVNDLTKTGSGEKMSGTEALARVMKGLPVPEHLDTPAYRSTVLNSIRDGRPTPDQLAAVLDMMQSDKVGPESPPDLAAVHDALSHPDTATPYLVAAARLDGKGYADSNWVPKDLGPDVLHALRSGNKSDFLWARSLLLEMGGVGSPLVQRAAATISDQEDSSDFLSLAYVATSPAAVPGFSKAQQDRPTDDQWWNGFQQWEKQIRNVEISSTADTVGRVPFRDSIGITVKGGAQSTRVDKSIVNALVQTGAITDATAKTAVLNLPVTFRYALAQTASTIYDSGIKDADEIWRRVSFSLANSGVRFVTDGAYINMVYDPHGHVIPEKDKQEPIISGLFDTPIAANVNNTDGKAPVPESRRWYSSVLFGGKDIPENVRTVGDAIVAKVRQDYNLTADDVRNGTWSIDYTTTNAAQTLRRNLDPSVARRYGPEQIWQAGGGVLTLTLRGGTKTYVVNPDPGSGYTLPLQVSAHATPTQTRGMEELTNTLREKRGRTWWVTPPAPTTWH